jgi:hypothetical protein
MDQREVDGATWVDWWPEDLGDILVVPKNARCFTVQVKPSLFDDEIPILWYVKASFLQKLQSFCFLNH